MPACAVMTGIFRYWRVVKQRISCSPGYQIYLRPGDRKSRFARDKSKNTSTRWDSNGLVPFFNPVEKDQGVRSLEVHIRNPQAILGGQ